MGFWHFPISDANVTKKADNATPDPIFAMQSLKCAYLLLCSIPVVPVVLLPLCNPAI